MVRLFEAYRNDNDQTEFKFLHVFIRIESCEKLTEFWLSLATGKEAEGVQHTTYCSKLAIRHSTMLRNTTPSPLSSHKNMD